MIVLEVLGTPAPKGSGRAMLIAGKARLIASSSSANATDQARWDKAIREVALAQPVRMPPGPLAVTIEFRMPRPKGQIAASGFPKASAPAVPTAYPDVDKLVRCTLDALVPKKRRNQVVAEGVIDDDSRIVRITAMKVYATPGQEGARIVVEVFTAESWSPAS